MKNPAFRITGIVLISLIIGICSAWWTLTGLIDAMTVKNGPWRVNLSIGTAQTNRYLRAGVARIGLFALKNTEAVYFIALNDSEGEPLTSRCDYRIVGGEFDARWWSITVYGSDFHLIPNEQNRYSFLGGTLPRDKRNRWIVSLSAKPQEGNWLPAGDNEQLYLNLRLYRPGKSVYEHPDTIPLPEIIREVCR